MDDAAGRPARRARHSLSVAGYIAPAGTALGLGEALAGLLAGASRSDAHTRLATALAQHAHHDGAWLVSTGRAAMTVALKAMYRAAPGRRQVIVPAYTCYSVPAAVKLAGLEVRLCDVDPRTLSLDARALENFDTTQVLAVVSANLYGLPNDLPALETFAKARGIFMLDDAAQALGASMGARPVGGFGAAGLYSFDKGKNITSIEGGALVAGAALRPHVEAQYAALAPTRGSRTAVTAAKLLLYSMMLRPRAYSLMNKLPLGLGATPWEDNYALARYSPVLAAVAWRLFGRLPSLTRQRRDNAQRLADALQDCAGVELPTVLPTAEPAWARFPILLNAARRAAAIAALNGAGIGATASYPRALCDVPQVQAMIPAADCEQPGARDIASRIVTLPTHAYVPADLGRAVRAVLARAA